MHRSPFRRSSTICCLAAAPGPLSYTISEGEGGKEARCPEKSLAPRGYRGVSGAARQVLKVSRCDSSLLPRGPRRCWMGRHAHTPRSHGPHTRKSSSGVVAQEDQVVREDISLHQVRLRCCD